MEKNKKLNTANILRNVARYTLLTITIIVIGFALLSGSETYGGGVEGILKNSPNTLPWLSLLVFNLIAWKWELAGGIAITLFGLITIYFFNSGPVFFISTFLLTLLITVLGSLFIASWFLRKESSLTNSK